MKEIHFTSGYPTDEWVGVEYKKRHKLPAKIGLKKAYIADKFRILEGECEGVEVSPEASFIEVRKRRS